MEKNYQQCLEMILHHEGGYVNHPEDPGGATNLGVTKRVYEEWIGRTVTLDKSVCIKSPQKSIFESCPTLVTIVSSSWKFRF